MTTAKSPATKRAPARRRHQVQRATDPTTQFRVDRTIPAWGLVSMGFAVVVMLFGQAMLMWAGQREANIKMDNLIASVNTLSSKLEKQDAALAQTNSGMVEMKAALADLTRRMLRVETRVDAKP